MLFELFQLLLLLGRQLFDKFLAGHVEVLEHIDADDNLDVLEGVNHLVGWCVGLAEDHRVGARSCFTGIFAGGGNLEGVFRGVAAIVGKTDRADRLRCAGGVGHVAMNLASGRGGRLLRNRGQKGECQQAQPK